MKAEIRVRRSTIRPINHLAIWKFIDDLKAEQNVNKTKIEQDNQIHLEEYTAKLQEVWGVGGAWVAHW